MEGNEGENNDFVSHANETRQENTRDKSLTSLADKSDGSQDITENSEVSISSSDGNRAKRVRNQLGAFRTKTNNTLKKIHGQLSSWRKDRLSTSEQAGATSGRGINDQPCTSKAATLPRSGQRSGQNTFDPGSSTANGEFGFTGANIDRPQIPSEQLVAPANACAPADAVIHALSNAITSAVTSAAAAKLAIGAASSKFTDAALTKLGSAGKERDVNTLPATGDIKYEVPIAADPWGNPLCSSYTPQGTPDTLKIHSVCRKDYQINYDMDSDLRSDFKVKATTLPINTDDSVRAIEQMVEQPPTTSNAFLPLPQQPPTPLPRLSLLQKAMLRASHMQSIDFEATKSGEDQAVIVSSKCKDTPVTSNAPERISPHCSNSKKTYENNTKQIDTAALEKSRNLIIENERVTNAAISNSTCTIPDTNPWAKEAENGVEINHPVENDRSQSPDHFDVDLGVWGLSSLSRSRDRQKSRVGRAASEPRGTSGKLQSSPSPAKHQEAFVSLSGTISNGATKSDEKVTSEVLIAPTSCDRQYAPVIEVQCVGKTTESRTGRESTNNEDAVDRHLATPDGQRETKGRKLRPAPDVPKLDHSRFPELLQREFPTEKVCATGSDIATAQHVNDIANRFQTVTLRNNPTDENSIKQSSKIKTNVLNQHIDRVNKHNPNCKEDQQHSPHNLTATSCNETSNGEEHILAPTAPSLETPLQKVTPARTARIPPNYDLPMQNPNSTPAPQFHPGTQVTGSDRIQYASEPMAHTPQFHPGTQVCYSAGSDRIQYVSEPMAHTPLAPPRLPFMYYNDTEPRPYMPTTEPLSAAQHNARTSSFLWFTRRTGSNFTSTVSELVSSLRGKSAQVSRQFSNISTATVSRDSSVGGAGSSLDHLNTISGKGSSRWIYTAPNRRSDGSLDTVTATESRDSATSVEPDYLCSNLYQWLIVNFTCCCCWPVGLAAWLITAMVLRGEWRSPVSDCIRGLAKQVTLIAMLVGVAFYFLAFAFVFSLLTARMGY